jgi:hypothetical protein
MSTTNIYRVVYHFEVNGKSSGSQHSYSDYVSVASADYNSIKTVLSNNNKLQAGTLVIDGIHSMPSGSGTVLT